MVQTDGYDLQGNEGSQNPFITITVYSNNYGDDECYDISMKAKELMLSYGFQCKTGPVKIDNADPAVARWVSRYQRTFGSGDELRKLNLPRDILNYLDEFQTDRKKLIKEIIN